jgi:hypothetical protein
MKSSEMSPADDGPVGGRLLGAPGFDGVGGRGTEPPGLAGCAGLRFSTCDAGDFLKNENATEESDSVRPEVD